MKKILIGAGILVVGVLLHLWLRLDKEIFFLINGLHYRWLDKIILPISYCGDGTVLFIVALGVWRVRGWKRFLLVALILASTGILVQSIKHIFPYLRPVAVLTDIHILGPALKAYSFPSGHSASSFALATFIAEDFPKLRSFVWSVAIVIGISRIYVGAHFPADILAGAGLGCLIAYAWLHFSKRRIEV